MGYLFAFVTPFLDSFANYLDKFLLSNRNVHVTVLTVFSGIFAFLGGLVVLLFIGFNYTDWGSAIILTLSGFFSVFILFLYFRALTFDEASRVASLFQFIPVAVLVLSYVFLKETLRPQQYIGCIFIIIAGLLLSLRRLNSGFLTINKAFWYMLGAASLAAVVVVLFKLGVGKAGFWESIVYEGLGNGLGALSIVLAGGNFRLIREETRKISKRIFLYIALMGFIYRLSRYSFYLALLLIPASIVSVLQGFQPLFLLIEGVILSFWFPNILKEVVTKKTVGIKVLAVICIFAGLYMIF